jgi:ankyrin repeat protein
VPDIFNSNVEPNKGKLIMKFLFLAVNCVFVAFSCLIFTGCGTTVDSNTVSTESSLLDEIRNAIETKQDLNARTSWDNKYTLLHVAALSGFEKATELLVQNSVNVNSKDFIGATPLHRAVQNGMVMTASILIRNGADIEAREKTRSTPLVFAVLSERNTDSVVKLLLDAGAHVNVVDDSNFTPLHWAAFTGHAGAAELLLKAGADVNAMDLVGDSALHTAAQRGKWKVVEVLLKYGAKVNCINNRGGTPLDVAMASHDTDRCNAHDRQKVLNILRLHGGVDVNVPKYNIVASPNVPNP